MDQDAGPGPGPSAQPAAQRPPRRALRLNAFRKLPPRLSAGVILVTIVSLLTIFAFRDRETLRHLEAGANDVLRVILSPLSEAQDKRITVLRITEDTLALFPYRSPVNREFLATIIGRLDQAGVKAIGVDILFDQATEPQKDQALIDALQAFRGPKVVAWADARAGLRPKQEKWLNDFVAASGAEAGFATVTYDKDGVVRRFDAGLDGVDIRSLPAQLIEGAGGAVPVEKGLVDWRRETAEGKPAFPMLPAHLLLNPKLPPQLLKGWFGGRYVLIGADLEQTDRHETSLAVDPTVTNRTQPGVLLHAHVLAQMLDGREVVNWDLDRPQGAALTALLALLGAGLGLRQGAAWLKAAGFVAIGGAYLGCVGFFASLGGPYLPVAPPVVAFVLAFGLGGVAEAFISFREKAFIRQAFSHYLEPQMVDRLARDKDSLRLGGERREISFIFTDIAGFTDMSEKLPPDVLTQMLNAYFDGISDILDAHDGMIDKFIGDAVVALFGAAATDERHAANAIRAAAAMDEFAEDFRKRHAHLGLGVTRIGVHSGAASVGNFGGRRRFDFTAMGDAMNTAARLESINKALGTRVTVSDAARKLALAQLSAQEGGLPALRRSGRLMLKGKAEAIAAWNLAPDMSAPQLAAHEAAYARMAAGEAEAARAGFAALAESRPGDGLVALHLRRLDAGEADDRVG